MDVEHQFAFDFILGSAEPFGVLDDGDAVAVIDEVGVVRAFSFEEGAVWVALRGYKHKLDLFTEIGDKAGALHQLQLVGAVMFLAGGVAAGFVSAVFVVLRGRSRCSAQQGL